MGQYSLRVFNPHGEARCSADLCYDTLDSRPKRPLGDQYTDFEEFRMSGAPVPLADRPIINLITDRYLTLSWKPSIPIGPRIPVTYEVKSVFFFPFFSLFIEIFIYFYLNFFPR